MTPLTLLFGGSGQLGSELRSRLGAGGELLAPPHGAADFRDPALVADHVRRSAPRVVVNAAAYTAVDAAEADRAGCALVNRDAPGAVAEACREVGAALVHFSTNFVFDGSLPRPYREVDATGPLNVYGATKLEGESLVRERCERHLIVRTALVFSRGGESFVRRMLKLAREREELSVVNDQFATPTRAASLAEAVVRAIAPVLRGEEIEWGTYHLTSSGSASIHEFAEAVLALDPHREEQRCRVVRPVPTSEYPTPARRPANGVLDCAKFAGTFGVTLHDWHAELEAEMRGA